MLYNTIIFLLETATEEKKWYTNFFESIGKQIKEFAHEFAEFFEIIKRNTFDKLVEQFGATGVLIALFTLIIIVSMIVITAVIRGKE